MGETITSDVQMSDEGQNLTVTIDSKVEGDRLLTVTIDKNKAVWRKTNIRFVGKRGDEDIINFFKNHGVRLKHLDFSVKYSDEGHYVDWDTVKALGRHGIPCTALYYPIQKRRWDAVQDIRDTFDVQELNFEFWDYSLDCRSFDLPEAKHIELVKKLYQPMKAEGYEIKHECETEIMNGSC